MFSHCAIPWRGVTGARRKMLISPRYPCTTHDWAEIQPDSKKVVARVENQLKMSRQSPVSAWVSESIFTIKNTSHVSTCNSCLLCTRTFTQFRWARVIIWHCAQLISQPWCQPPCRLSCQHELKLIRHLEWLLWRSTFCQTPPGCVIIDLWFSLQPLLTLETPAFWYQKLFFSNQSRDVALVGSLEYFFC